MNGVHDMGGMHGMGPIVCARDEPVFHHAWEGRVYAMTRAMRAWRHWTLDSDRHAIEQLPPADYLRMSYYERWLAALIEQLVRYGLVTREEIADGRAAPGAPRVTPALTADMVPRMLGLGIASAGEPAVRARFAVGERVRARNLNPTGHTRLPRYARGKQGWIVRDRGVYAFPDTAADERGAQPQHVYTVRFAARELWGEAASARDSVHLDLWDDYLEHD
jgi:nitrile hydratase subunit beta